MTEPKEEPIGPSAPIWRSMKTELRDDNIPTASLSPVEDTPVGSFRRVLKNRSFLLLWLAQLLSQIVFNAANYGVIAIVTAVTHSTVLVGLAIISFTLPAVPFSLLAGVYVDYLDKRLVLWVSNALRAVTTGLIVFALLGNPHMLVRSEEHTSELQSHSDLVCRLLLEKKKS